MIHKLILLVCGLVVLAGLADAQGFGAEVDGGLQGMHYTLQNGNTKVLPGGLLGLDYTFRLYKNWGLLTGIQGAIYRTQATLQDGLGFSYNEVDDAGTAFRYTVRTEGYKETQRSFAVTIPLLLQYHTPGAGLQWYIDGGGKLFLPVSTKSQVSAQQLVLSGYYPNYDLVVSDLPEHGFGTLTNWKGSASAQLKPGAALSAGTGVSFGISRGMRFYAGVYFDYGLNSVRNGGDSMSLVNYSSGGTDKVRPAGVLKMQNAGQPKLFAYGLQLRLSFGATPYKASPKKHVQALPVSTAPISDSELIVIQRPVIFGIAGVSDIPQTQLSILDDVAAVMSLHPGLRISIIGYTCNGVNEKETPRLGADRAKSVAHYLEQKGIDRGRMDVDYFRETEASRDYDPAANYRSRRVVITAE